MEIKVISIETIKPSSPTPKSLQKHNLSFIDQLAPPVFVPIVYFYSSNPKIPNSQISHRLKKTLSETLSRFYPLAGRLVGNLYVDCNDAGVPFTEAEADCNLSQVITNRDPNNMFELAISHETLGLCIAVQATYFRCGGVAIGILISHRVSDALSLFAFTNTWSSFARHGGAAAVPPPKFDAAAYFPPRDIPDHQPTLETMKEEVVCRIFTFPASEIAALRERYSAGSGRRRPSRVEALSAFIWTRFASATGVRSDPNKTCAVVHLVNLRTRADPPMSGSSFGNVFGYAMAKPAATDGGAEVVRRVRKAVNAVNGGYVAKMRNGENLMEEIVGLVYNEEVVSFSFTSLCGFPSNEADFGLGKPVWLGHGGFRADPFPYKNMVSLMDANSEGGIDALIQLTKQDMEKFEISLLKSNL